MPSPEVASKGSSYSVSGGSHAPWIGQTETASVPLCFFDGARDARDARLEDPWVWF
jgi:hypothetical protein